MAISEKARRYEEFRNSVTYADVLTYALALTSLTEFSGNPDGWQKVIFEACNKFRDQIPELHGIHFSRRPPDIPRCDEERET